jgi:hypothetical protein
MCVLALYYRAVEDAPLVVGANRDEEYRRGGSRPALHRVAAAGHAARAVFGTDPTAGGTWLGVNEHGVFVAVTNRKKTHLPPQPRSRGLLARELLAFPNAQQATAHATAELQRGVYAGCNFLCADASAASVVHAGDWLRVRPLPPGLHVLTNGDVNDASDPRARHVLAWLGEQACRSIRPFAYVCPTPAPSPAASWPCAGPCRPQPCGTRRGPPTTPRIPTIRSCCASWRANPPDPWPPGAFLRCIPIAFASAAPGTASPWPWPARLPRPCG